MTLLDDEDQGTDAQEALTQLVRHYGSQILEPIRRTSSRDAGRYAPRSRVVFDDGSSRGGPTPDQGYGLFSAAQPGEPQGSEIMISGNNGADLGGALHPPVIGTHVHEHAAFDGPDLNNDGIHVHEHSHDGDAVHRPAQHNHDGAVDEDSSFVGYDDGTVSVPATASRGWQQPGVHADYREYSPRTRAQYPDGLDDDEAEPEADTDPITRAEMRLERAQDRLDAATTRLQERMFADGVPRPQSGLMDGALAGLRGGRSRSALPQRAHQDIAADELEWYEATQEFEDAKWALNQHLRYIGDSCDGW